MIGFVRRYWAELLAFGAIFAILMIDITPDYTYINKAADSIGYAYSARYLYPSYHTSAPLYLLLSHVFLWIPFGTEAWRMALISAFSTMGACVFLYLIIRHSLEQQFAVKNDGMTLTLTANYVDKKLAEWETRFYAILGVLAYGTSALVISQSTIVNTYAFVTMFAVGAYWFAINNKWKLTAVMLGLGLAVHLLGAVVFVLFFIFKGYRKNWKAILITVSFVAFYLYIPITSRPPYMWLPNPANVNTFEAIIGDTLSVIAMLVGTLSVWDLPKKIFDTIGLVGLSIGVITIIPIIYYIKKTGKNILITPLFWLIAVPILIFVGELDMNTYDYTMVSIPFLIIMACLGLKMMVERYKVKGKQLVYATFIVIIGLGSYNAYYFDIGNQLDPNMSASKLFYEEFPKIPDGAIYMPNGGWNWEAMFKYNKDYGKNIYPICIDILPSETYRKQLQDDGVKLEYYENDNLSISAWETAKSIVRLNDNVYTSVYTNTRTFGSEVVFADHNTDLINKVDVALIEKNKTNPDWHWIPSNPYHIITSELFIDEWGYVVMSRYNFMFFFLTFLIIYALMIFIPRLTGRKRKNAVISQKKEVTTTK